MPIYAYERGDERTEAVTQLLDFNVRKTVDLGEARFEVGVDAANLFNSQPPSDSSRASARGICGRPRA